MGDSVTFTVVGTPVPQGSKKAFVRGKRAVIVDDNAAKLKPWREAVACAADVGVMFDCPVAVLVRFYMPMPLKPKFDRPAVKPDVDKLCRAVLDGLTDGGLLRDDSRVVRLVGEQWYSESPRAEVTVREVTE